MTPRWCLSLLLLIAACRSPAAREPATTGMTAPGFRGLLERVAAGWNAGDARAAAAAFAETAVYEEPPAKQIYRGRAALFAFFGGDQKLPMMMRWHHIAFDETTQTGFGEYTFKLTGQYHGIVVVRVRDGLITHWREYQYKSDLPYDDFARETRF
jgi:hypothetical protein